MRGPFAARPPRMSPRTSSNPERSRPLAREGRPRALLSWSGGKDSAMTLHESRRSGKYEVVALLTTMTRDYDRVSMHGVRRALLRKQGEAVGLPIEEGWINRNASNEEYEARMKAVLEEYRLTGVRDVLFGDLFLQDIRRY